MKSKEKVGLTSIFFFIQMYPSQTTSSTSHPVAFVSRVIVEFGTRVHVNLR